MTEPKITVTGIPETQAALAAFGERAANDIEVAGQAAAIVAAAASIRAPVLTGALAASYTVSERYVVSDLPYAGPVEYGTDRMVAPVRDRRGDGGERRAGGQHVRRMARRSGGRRGLGGQVEWLRGTGSRARS